MNGTKCVIARLKVRLNEVINMYPEVDNIFRVTLGTYYYKAT